ncbi:MAG: 50S ribosomal protein L18 [Sphingobacteriia bacterium]|nr:50S ribosomal protein L18 [Sphingobacteriia bacterium]
MGSLNANKRFDRREQRVRAKIRKTTDRLRLSVFRSGKNIYAQIIDDVNGNTLVSASSVDKLLRTQLKKGSTVEAAKIVGKELAQRAKSKNIALVVFDKGGYKYHGRIKALADAAREGGLEF